ncbi:MAG: hypothetical protein P1V97_21280 [Planctomycetota bacterium]|nr:hypothetical protein [Planctomycetota bacterium]
MLKSALQTGFFCLVLASTELALAQEPIVERPDARGTDWGGVICAAPILILFVFLLVKYGAPESFLCDRCQYNDQRYCNQPDRPNATSCDEFKAK